MPTIIALDVSLSMTRAVPVATNGTNDDNITYSQLAIQGINEFLNYLTKNSKLEHVSLLVYSSKYDVLVDFTRDYDAIRQALYNVEHYDKLCLENMLRMAGSILLSSWGSQNHNQIVVFTHCGVGLGVTSLQSTIANLTTQNASKAASASSSSSSSNALSTNPQYLLNDVSRESWIPFSSLSKLSFICLGSTVDPYFQNAIELYQQFLDVSGQKGKLFIAHIDSENDNKITKGTNCNFPSQTYPTTAQWKSDIITHLIEELCETNYKPFEATLNGGDYHKLESPVIIWPAPMPHDDGKDGPKMISRTIIVCGFLNLSDIGSPMSLSRHLVLPNENATTNCAQGTTDMEKMENDIKSFLNKSEDEENGEQNKSNNESAALLLHGALKFENLAAVVLLNDDWFGFLHSYSDIKRKSNIILTILPPGNDNIPWLGDFQYFATADEALPGENAQFPIKPEKRSYSQNCVVWIKQAGLQSDIQKLLRHAKKLPEKTQQFYKELNRIRRAALSLGFVELLEALSTLFEREALLLPQNVSPDCGIQLKHSAIELRKLSNRDLKISLSPIPTKYNQLV
ncbi:integrator complex subunit 14 [Contarinia nasturtii]|uniref:integrator complex subunit 14 n=1 Tax=Contarinia nasturtii TaxID=265458 RepID=UPI0012D3FE02|nr:integrator complex subunit 14 [Contarinia nasturtii]